MIFFCHQSIVSSFVLSAFIEPPIMEIGELVSAIKVWGSYSMVEIVYIYCTCTCTIPRGLEASGGPTATI